MARGKFVWLLGDDDLIVKGSLKEVIKFIEAHENEEIGIITFGYESYCIDAQTKKKVLCERTVEENEPEVIKLRRKEIITTQLPELLFMSVVVLNNQRLKEIFEEDAEIVSRGIGVYHYHTFLCRLISAKYPNLKHYKLNKVMVLQKRRGFKTFVEGEFLIHYGLIKLNNTSLYLKYLDKQNQMFKMMREKTKKANFRFVCSMIANKAVDFFAYDSRSGCVKTFFKNVKCADAIVISLFFTILSMIPSAIIKTIHRAALRVKYKPDEVAFIREVLSRPSKLHRLSEGEQRRV
jgi:hypothetical protein